MLVKQNQQDHNKIIKRQEITILIHFISEIKKKLAMEIIFSNTSMV